VTVPDVVGLAQAAAQTAITDAGLAVGAVTQEASDTVPVGDVISQNPAAGTSVAPGSAVAFVVSLGPPVTVPNVVGLPQAAAQTAITDASLTVGAVTLAASETVPAGNVISQNPVAGTSVAPGSAVALVVSLGPPVTVPNVVGLPQAAAQTAITDASLTVGAVTHAASDTVPAGNVISQNPAAGTSVAPGSAVALVISLGPPVTVPNVVGLAQAAAQTAITDVGLTVGTVTQAHSGTVPAGDVISQNPAAGASVAPGSAVDLVISLGPAPVTVPDVVGLAQAAAQTAITDASLTVGTVTQDNSDTVPAGAVISQNPAAGASVAPGSAIDLVVSLGPVPLIVTSLSPNTADRSTAFDATITGSGFGGDAQISFSGGSGPAPSVTSWSVDSATLISATIQIKSGGRRRTSVWDMIVTSRGLTAVLPNALTVLS
jgi:beta-lactam-binding protein with PASTA domain